MEIPGLTEYIVANRSKFAEFLTNKYITKYKKVVISIPSEDFIMIKFYLDIKYVVIITIKNDEIVNNSGTDFLYCIISDINSFFRKNKIINILD